MRLIILLVCACCTEKYTSARHTMLSPVDVHIMPLTFVCYCLGCVPPGDISHAQGARRSDEGFCAAPKSGVHSASAQRLCRRDDVMLWAIFTRTVLRSPPVTVNCTRTIVLHSSTQPRAAASRGRALIRSKPQSSTTAGYTSYELIRGNQLA